METKLGHSFWRRLDTFLFGLVLLCPFCNKSIVLAREFPHHTFMCQLFPLHSTSWGLWPHKSWLNMLQKNINVAALLHAFYTLLIGGQAVLLSFELWFVNCALHISQVNFLPMYFSFIPVSATNMKEQRKHFWLWESRQLVQLQHSTTSNSMCLLLLLLPPLLLSGECISDSLRMCKKSDS